MSNKHAMGCRIGRRPMVVCHETKGALQIFASGGMAYLLAFNLVFSSEWKVEGKCLFRTV